MEVSKLEYLLSETGESLVTGALPYIEESMDKRHIDRLNKYLDSYIAAIRAEVDKINIAQH